MDPSIRSILIVGGGTSGWLSAAYLNRALGDSVAITLIESDAVPRVGVGEATIPTLVNTVRFLGIDEKDWLRESNGTYKAAIQYRDWAVGPRGPGEDRFYHPFFDRPEMPIMPFERPWFPLIGDGISSATAWVRRAAAGERRRYDDLASPIPALCDAGLFEPSRDPKRLVYAYHMDAGLAAAYLRTVAVGRGVGHVVDHIEHVGVDERGFVTGVRTRGGRHVEADLYLDCSGFGGLIVNRTLGEPFDADARFLPADAAVAIQTPNHPDRDGIRPYTIAQAHDAGWSWSVPLYHRNGCGYVYCSQFVSRDEVEAELRRHLGPDADDMPALHLKMRVGRTRRPWLNNCVAVGLSAMFVEPLESTGIFLVEYQLGQLVRLFPDRRFDPATAALYNASLHAMYEHIRDFIVMHYCTTKREDTPFWRHVRHDLPIPDTLAATLEGFRQGHVPADWEGVKVFRAQSFTSILAGMRVYPEHAPGLLAHLDRAREDRHFAEVRAAAERLLADTPPHLDTIRAMHGPR